MSRITEIYYNNVDSTDYSCFVHIVTSPPIPAEATFYVNVNATWIPVFPNEINPGEFYQRVYDLKNGDNEIQFRIEYEGVEYLSDKINVMVNGQVPEVLPPRVPTPPIIIAEEVSAIRRLPCKIEYAVNSDDPVIAHYYSEDGGKTWDEIQPAYQDKTYNFSLYYKLAGDYKIHLKVVDNYWDESEIVEVPITIKKGEGDEPGLIASDTEEFSLVIAVPDEPEPEQPRIYYVINCGGYSDQSLAEKEKKKLIDNGFKEATIEKRQV